MQQYGMNQGNDLSPSSHDANKRARSEESHVGVAVASSSVFSSAHTSFDIPEGGVGGEGLIWI